MSTVRNRRSSTRQTDESPLAARSLLPILRTFTEPAGIKKKDISRSPGILPSFLRVPGTRQRVEDCLAELGQV